ncbi:MAG: hypothetical protein QM714_02065 [Nocardioides sp.]|uniref:hypothetical protein n=1 Tax=Nocardioides sp. TaxID=35761 RepID=UPI0039E2DAD4
MALTETRGARGADPDRGRMNLVFLTVVSRHLLAALYQTIVSTALPRGFAARTSSRSLGRRARRIHVG